MCRICSRHSELFDVCSIFAAATRAWLPPPVVCLVGPCLNCCSSCFTAGHHGRTKTIDGRLAANSKHALLWGPHNWAEKLQQVSYFGVHTMASNTHKYLTTLFVAQKVKTTTHCHAPPTNECKTNRGGMYIHSSKSWTKLGILYLRKVIQDLQLRPFNPHIQKTESLIYLICCACLFLLSSYVLSTFLLGRWSWTFRLQKKVLRSQMLGVHSACSSQERYYNGGEWQEHRRQSIM